MKMSKPEHSDNKNQKNTWRICAIFLPDLKGTSTTTVTSTLHLFEPLAQEIFTITGNFPENTISSEKIHIINIGIKQEDNTRSPMVVRLGRFILLQLKISYNLIKIASKIDIVFLAAGTQALFLPALAAKLLRKRLILMHLGLGVSLRKGYQTFFEKTLFGVGKYVFPWFVELMERVNYCLSDRIIDFLPNSDSPRSKRYSKKTSFGGSRFYVDTESFKVERNLSNRENLVGYIGRFEEVKGVMNFVRAIPLMLRESAVSKVLIAGDGQQRDDIEKVIKDANWGNETTLMGWIPHNELPQYLNEIKLLVIPSYVEVGPHLIFEAIACGTPVLATSVGVMPSVIKDGETVRFLPQS